MNIATATVAQVNRIAAVQLAAELLDTDSSAELINLADYLTSDGEYAPEGEADEGWTDPIRDFAAADLDNDTLEISSALIRGDGAAYVSVRPQGGISVGVFVTRSSIDAAIATLTNLRADYDAQKR